MNAARIRIDYLAQHPALADELARWSWAEWRAFYAERGRTFADVLSSYKERARTDGLPLALVAFDGGQLVGTVSLKPDDLDTRPEITPWLASLFVVPAARRRGIAARLVDRAVAKAERLQLPTLFLWTASAEALYRKLGWRVVERTEYCGKPIAIMQTDLQRSHGQRATA